MVDSASDKTVKFELSVDVPSQSNQPDPYLTYVLPSLTSLAWPLAIIVLVLSFRRFIIRLMGGAREFSFEIAGQKLSLTRREALNTLDQLLEEIIENTKDLDEAQRALFHRILNGKGRTTVSQIYPQFERGSAEHNLLRSLRSRTLIRPAEGGTWRSNKHPEVAAFAGVLLKSKGGAIPKPRNPDAYLLRDDHEQKKYADTRDEFT
jgi:hypothetical protein